MENCSSYDRGNKVNKKEYLLVCAMEEAASFQKALSKCIRFTPSDFFGENNESNINLARREFSKLIAILDELEDQGIVIVANPDIMDEKKKSLFHYSNRSIMLGVLNGF